MSNNLKFQGDYLYDGSKKIGMVKNGCIYEGTSSRRLGNARSDCIYEGASSTPGFGRRIGNVKKGYVYSGSSSSPGSGRKVCEVDDCRVFKGCEYLSDELIVAVYHFLIEPIL